MIQHLGQSHVARETARGRREIDFEANSKIWVVCLSVCVVLETRRNYEDLLHSSVTASADELFFLQVNQIFLSFVSEMNSLGILTGQLTS